MWRLIHFLNHKYHSISPTICSILWWLLHWDLKVSEATLREQQLPFTAYPSENHSHYDYSFNNLISTLTFLYNEAALGAKRNDFPREGKAYYTNICIYICNLYKVEQFLEILGHRNSIIFFIYFNFLFLMMNQKLSIICFYFPF